MSSLRRNSRTETQQTATRYVGHAVPMPKEVGCVVDASYQQQYVAVYLFFLCLHPPG